MARANQTAHDAFLRVLDARTGSLADATPAYLEHLHLQLSIWLERVDAEIVAVRQREDAETY